MTYVEGASLHQDRAGSTVFARYAFNELWSFVAGWAILLDYVILLAVCVVLGDELPRAVLERARGGRGRARRLRWRSSLYVAVRNVLGFSADALAPDLAARRRRPGGAAGADRARPGRCCSTSSSSPTRSTSARRRRGRTSIFALGDRDRAFTGLESASGLARRGRRRAPRTCGGWSVCGSLTVVVVYAGIALVAISALPVVDGADGARHVATRTRPFLGVADAFEPDWLRRRPEVRDRGRRGGDARRGGQLGDARPLAPGLLAGHQPPDPERARHACTRRARRRSS